MADGEYKRLTCGSCATTFLWPPVSGRRAKDCDDCRLEAATTPRPTYARCCGTCGAAFTALVANAKFCSRKCKKVAWLQADPDRAAHQQREKKRRELERVHASDSFKRRKVGRSLAKTLRLLMPIKRALEREMLSKVPCAVCGCEVGIGEKGARKYCSKACKESSEVTQEIRRRSRASYYAAKKANTIETFDPIEIFERDKWRCQLCGVKTPRSLRGTNDPRAPELDHIIPISQNGAHARFNAQCACKRCNRAKSDKPLGQMLLVG